MRNNLFEKADPLVREIYRITLNLPQKFQYSLADQLRRSSLSIVLNIVEGGARRSEKEKRQFMNIAFGSLKETKYLIYFASNFELIEKTKYEDLMIRINELARIMYSILYKSRNTKQ